MLKCDEKFLYGLLTLSQEQVLSARLCLSTIRPFSAPFAHSYKQVLYLFITEI